jgi:hypothetical protein
MTGLEGPSAAVVLATRDRERDIHRALHALVWELPANVIEMFVVSPFLENQALIAEFDGAPFPIHHLLDAQHGKPAALNLGLGRATAELVVVTDGDVTVEAGAVTKLLRAFDDPAVGAATGRPVPLHDRVPRGPFAYWGKVLLAEADRVRTRAMNRGTAAALPRSSVQRDPIECTGYLYAFRRGLLGALPEDILVEDAYVSGIVMRDGNNVAYVRDARVRVRPPEGLGDWHRQKLRAMVGSQQPLMRQLPRMRRFGQEAAAAPMLFARYARSPREAIWLIGLILARLAVWIHAAILVRRGPIDPLDYWHPIATTKSQPPAPGDVYEIAAWTLPGAAPTVAQCHRCVVLAVEPGGGLRVAIISGAGAAGRTADHVIGNAVVPASVLIGEGDLGNPIGRCSASTLASLRKQLL